MGKLSARWKAFLAKEKEKTKDMTFRQKVEYVFEYYKVEFFAVVLAVALVGALGYAIDNKTNTHVLYVAVADTEATMEQNLQLGADFKKYIGNTRRKDKVTIDGSITVLGTNGDEITEFYQEHQKSLVLLASGIVDVYVCEKAYVDFLEDYEDLLPVSEALGEELCAKYADRIEDDRAILLSKGAAEACGITYEPVYLAFSRSVHYPEVARSFAQFLLEK